jgi:hypothetical protein
MSGRQLTTTDVTVSTVSVQIKALTIGRKQMTMAVFRQLVAEDLIDPQTCQLLGVPWGLVNYHPGCDEDWTHLYVLWQREDQLRQATVSHAVPSGLRASWEEAGEARLRRYCVLACAEGGNPALETALDFHGAVRAHVNGFTLWATVPEPVRLIIRRYDTVLPLGKPWRKHAAYRDALAQVQDVVPDLGPGPQTAAEAAEALTQVAAEYEDACRRYDEQYRTLETLDQLFIAV